jgi:hypothetical protein
MLKKLFLLSLAVLAVGMAIPSTRAEIQRRAVTPAMDAVAKRIAPGQLEAMADQLDVRLSRGERLPTGFEGWLRRDYTGPELDPWDNPWYLQAGRRSYTVGSMGPDGARGTPDDIAITRDLPGGRFSR